MNELNIPLHDYQQYAKQFIIDHPYCGLFLDCGLGKTLITLSAFYEINPNGHVLIIAPKNIARSTWLDEIKKWHIPIRTKSLLVNEKGKKLSKKKRLELYNQIPTDPPTVYFISRDLISDLIKNMPVIDKRPIWYFPNIIIDEVQSFKSYKSERFKSLQRVLPCVSRLVGLTGTPTPNGLMDLWSEIYLLDMGQRLGKNITAYRNTFFNPGRYANGYPIEWIPKPGAEEEIHRRIADIVISIKNTNLKLPEVTYNNVSVYMDDDEMKLYKEFIKTQVLELENDVTLIAANAAVLQGKLSQMASGAIYIDDKHNYKIIHKKKLEQCEYIIENTGGPVLIAYHFQSDKDMLLDYFPDAKCFDGSPEMQAEWNAKQIPIMLIQPASAGFGLNLQNGGSTLIWYTLSWSLEEYIQTNKRLHRQGQTQSVIIHHLLTARTVDERILAALNKKDMTQSELLEAVKATIDDALTA